MLFYNLVNKNHDITLIYLLFLQLDYDLQNYSIRAIKYYHGNSTKEVDKSIFYMVMLGISTISLFSFKEECVKKS